MKTARLLLQIKEQVPLSKKTSYKIGGNSRYFAEPKNINEINEAVIWAKDNSQKIFILGKGSNILVDDSGWDGLTIDLSGLNYIKWKGAMVTCGGGTLLHTLVSQSVEKGLHGIEVLAGIPGSIGGGIVMNAGAFGGNISDYLLKVTLIDMDTMEVFCKEKEDMCFGYRTSILKQNPWIVAEAKFEFIKDDSISSQKIKMIYNDVVKKRKDKQPLNQPNCGSVFKRPENNYAGTLIEECGLKGYSIGGASVSEKHANFIVNKNNATAEDVKSVIRHVQNVILKEKGIKLEREVIFIGDVEKKL